MTDARSYFIVGGAGFIGSHFCDRLLSDGARVTVYDKMISGKPWHIDHHQENDRFRLVVADVVEEDRLASSMADHDVVIHLASNPDIARAATEPAIDFTAGTLLTHHVVEAMRRSGVSRLLYASGSGVYGDLGELELDEDFGPLIPISTYAASKIAGEALISSYCAMFDLRACAFRFGNVVGLRQTHGVGYDFLGRLRSAPDRLQVLGDGYQSKSYIHVSDVINAVLLADDRTVDSFAVYNVATEDYTTVREIADAAIAVLGLVDRTAVGYESSDRGWKGDVPVVRLNSERIRSVGWRNALTSREAIKASLEAMAADERHWS